MDGAARLREAGLRVTRPRQAVLNALSKLGGHRSADDVAAALRVRGEPLPRSSVYNVLADLVTHGLARRAEVGSGRELYEAAADWHHHFVCSTCGAIVDVPCAVGSRPCMDAHLPGAVIERAEVVYHGRCADCAQVA